jgi:tetratricopeptide (TPR) repeat protein
MNERRFMRTLAMTLACALSISGCTKEARKDRSVERADRYFAAEKFDDAEIEYRHALQLVAYDPVAIRQLGYLYLGEGRSPIDYVYLKKASELLPDDNVLRLRLAQCELPIGLAKEARANAVRVLQAKPVSADALLLLAQASRTSAEMDDARKLIESLKSQNGDQAGYHVALGALLSKTRSFDPAEAELLKAVSLDSKSADAYGELGEVYWQEHKADQAEKALRSASDLSPLRSVWRLRYVQLKLETGAVAEAKKILEDLNTRVPDYVPAWVATMKVAFQEKRYDDCAAVVQKILIRDSNNFEALFQRSSLKLVKGDTASAIDELEHLNSMYGRVAQLKYRLAVAYQQNGELTKAENTLFQAVAIEPDDDQAQILLSELELRKGDVPAAIERLTQILKVRPQAERAYLLLARALLLQKSPSQALVVYGRLQEIAPKDPQVPFLMGMAYLLEKRAPEARRAFEQSIALSPDWARSLEMLVSMDLASNQFGPATQRVVGLMRQYPKAAGPWVLMEKIHVAEKDLDAAEDDLLKAIDLDPSFQPAYLLLARLYVQTNKHQQALQKLNEIADRTKSANAFYQVGLIREELKDFDAARAAYERMLAIDPRSAPALDRLARLYDENLGKPDKALELAKRAHDLKPDDPQAADTLGWILFRQGDYHAALANLTAAAEREPDDTEVRYHLGMDHYMLGEEGPARLAFQQVVAASTDPLSKEDARKRLAFIDLDPSKADHAAETDLQAQVRADPKDPVAQVRLASIRARKGGAADAAKGFEAALKLNPRDVPTLLELVRLYSGPLHNSEKALEFAKTAHEIAPGDAQISRTLGRLLYDNGDYARSVDILQQAAKDIQGDPSFAYELARSLYSVGKVSQAEDAIKGAAGAEGSAPANLQQLQRLMEGAQSATQAQSELSEAQEILKSTPSDFAAEMVVALSREGQDAADARQLYEKILSQDALFVPAMRQLALLYAQHVEDEPKALELATKVREAFPDDPDVNKVLGVLDYNKSDYAGAARLLQRTLRVREGDAEALYYLGMAHYQLKELSTSRSELQQAVKLNLPDAEADDARRTLDEITRPTKGQPLSQIPIH